MRLSAFYDSYKEYCQQNGLKCSDEFDFVKRLSEVGISKKNKIFEADVEIFEMICNKF